MENPTWKYLWMSLGLAVFMLTMAWMSSLMPGLVGDGESNSLVDFVLTIGWLLPVPVLLLVAYLAFCAALQVNVAEEWDSWERKQEDFRELVDDLAVDEDFGRYSPAEQLHIARYITFFGRGTFRSMRDAKKLARQLAEQREILGQYQATPAPNVQDWRVRSKQWVDRSDRRTLERLRADGHVGGNR